MGVDTAIVFAVTDDRARICYKAIGCWLIAVRAFNVNDLFVTNFAALAFKNGN